MIYVIAVSVVLWALITLTAYAQQKSGNSAWPWQLPSLVFGGALVALNGIIFVAITLFNLINK